MCIIQAFSLYILKLITTLVSGENQYNIQKIKLTLFSVRDSVLYID